VMAADRQDPDVNVAAVVCAQCGRVRVGEVWRTVLPVGRLSHSICPTCAERLYGSIWRRRAEARRAA